MLQATFALSILIILSKHLHVFNVSQHKIYRDSLSGYENEKIEFVQCNMVRQSICYNTYGKLLSLAFS